MRQSDCECLEKRLTAARGARWTGRWVGSRVNVVDGRYARGAENMNSGAILGFRLTGRSANRAPSVSAFLPFTHQCGCLLLTLYFRSACPFFFSSIPR